MSFADFQALSEKGNVVPVYATHMADLLTPVSAFMKLNRHSNPAFLLESVEGGEKTARFSFLGCDPLATIRSSGDALEVEEEGVTAIVQENIFQYLSDRFAGLEVARPEGLPRFTGGAVGYFGYESIRHIENIPVHEKGEPTLPESLIMLFDTVLAFDHLRHQIYIIKNVFIEDRSESNLPALYREATEKIAAIKCVLDEPVAPTKPANSNGRQVTSNFCENDFCQAVVKAKQHILAGDIFQVVVSQRFTQEIGASPLDIYRALRVVNPAPYLYFLTIDDISIIGSSPELLVRVEDRKVEVRPIAGTRRRGKDEAEDQRLMAELQRDEKERAEHIMLVDLGRNDVGRVSEPGSVEVTEFMIVEKYSHVMHLVSNVEGKLKRELNALDALKAGFPAGTVSGAPKIRAMEIINELEQDRRGVYAGALGYLDFSGNLDTCIAIRTIVTKGNQAYFQAGAGIVADSVPEREYQETVDKAAALRAAIEFAERGLQ